MGWFSQMFGEGKHRDVTDISPVRDLLTQKEQYQADKIIREWQAEWDAEDDPRRIGKSIERHQQKARKCGEGQA